MPQLNVLDALQRELGDRYQIGRELGRGGAGRVFLAEDAGGQPLALKVLHPEFATGVMTDRFLREISTLSRLRHPRIANLVAWGHLPWSVYYLMDYIAGESLRSVLTREGTLSAERCRAIVLDILPALEFAHRQGVVHRDVKPENIQLSPYGTVLLDFGIARAIRVSANEKLTKSGMILGTPAYMSPEQAAGQTQLDPRTDIYALGAVLFECVAGRPPLEGPPEVQLRTKAVDPAPNVLTLCPGLPSGLAMLINRALSIRPTDRWESADRALLALKGAG